MDDGDGFDMDSLGNGQDNNSGLGIRNMHSRAKLIGADFSMCSAAGSGTMVRLIVPFLKSYN
jgi:signal transduction histidine kinase